MPRSIVSCDRIAIVGAGPTGLTLGIELAIRGVPCRLFDKRQHPSETSRSFTVQPRTAEGFARGGYVDPFLDVARFHQGMAIHLRGVENTEYIDFSMLDTPYPNILIVEQNDTEAVLRERFRALGGTIEWNTELTSITTDPDGRITAHLRHPDSAGTGRETIHPDWLIGCDGLGSIVRTQLGLDYTGDDYTGMRFRMMDVEMENPYPGSDTWIDYWVDTDRMLLTTALRRGHRVLISDMRDAPRARTQPDPRTARTAFQHVVDSWPELSGMRLGLPRWTTEFDIWRRLASGYRRGRLLVAGDAAHIHSPAAGMNMNTCIQDAFNLGWKLAAVATGSAPESLLDTYETERRPIATQVMQTSHELHGIMMNHGVRPGERRELIAQPEFHRDAAARIGALTYHYRDVIDAPGPAVRNGLAAGDRARNTPITATTDVHGLLAHPDHTLLVLQRRPRSTVAAAAARATAPYRDLLRTTVIAAPDLGADAPVGALIAQDTRIFEDYGQIANDTLCLIRPDGHIALRSDDLGALTTALGQVMLP